MVKIDKYLVKIDKFMLEKPTIFALSILITTVMSIKRISDKQLLEKLTTDVIRDLNNGHLDVRYLSSIVSLTPSQLNRRLKKISGLSVAQFVTLIRLTKAKRLLAKIHDGSVRSITEVSSLCGFSDPAHFSHVFRKVEGMSPSQYMRHTNSSSFEIHEFIQKINQNYNENQHNA